MGEGEASTCCLPVPVRVGNFQRTAAVIFTIKYFAFLAEDHLHTRTVLE